MQHHTHSHRGPDDSGESGNHDTVPAGHTGLVYTCPMHPSVRRTQPGSCPLCGMGLEPESAAMAEEGPNPELVDFTRRFRVGAVLTLPLLVLAMGPFVGRGGVREAFGERGALWIEVLLGTPVVLWCGWPFLARGWSSFRTMNLNMFSLIAMGGDGRLALQHGGRAGAGRLPRRLPRRGGQCRGLFRSRGGDRDAGASRSAHGAPRPPGHRQGNPRAARHGGQGRTRSPRGRTGGRDPARRRATRRPAAGAAGRQGAGRRRGGRRPLLRRREHDHGRADTRGEDAGRSAHRRDHQRHRQPDHGGYSSRRRHGAEPDRRDGRERAAEPGAHPAIRRQGGGPVRARGDRGRGRRVHRLGNLGPPRPRCPTRCWRRLRS